MGRYDEAKRALNEASLLASQSADVNKQLDAWIALFNGRMALSQLNFSEATRQSEQAISLSGDRFKDITIQAKYTLGLAHALAGKGQAGKTECEDALTRATSLGDPRLVSAGQLALAEALLETSDAAKAESTAVEAQTRFAQLGQKHSEWRAWSIAAQARARLGDHVKAAEYAGRAQAVLSQLQQLWPVESFESYLSRSDIQRSQRQLKEFVH
jgi:ATP/maltotriose-dependent transcriptional regulator MalT